MKSRKENIAAIALGAIDLWRASDAEYTCQQSVLDVVRPYIASRCAKVGMFKAQRTIENQVIDAIHRVWEETA